MIVNGNPYEFDFQIYDRWRPSLLQSFRQWVNRVRLERRRRREVRSLYGWSDHLLRDIGLTRADIEVVEGGMTAEALRQMRL